MSQTNYPVGDFLIKVKNAALAKDARVEDGLTNQKLAVAKALQKAGFVEGVKAVKGVLSLSLKFSHKSPIIMDIKLVSKPGKRVYFKSRDIQAKRGPSIFLLSTPKGILTSKEVRKLGVGGEVIAEIW